MLFLVYSYIVNDVLCFISFHVKVGKKLLFGNFNRNNNIFIQKYQFQRRLRLPLKPKRYTVSSTEAAHVHSKREDYVKCCFINCNRSSIDVKWKKDKRNAPMFEEILQLMVALKTASFYHRAATVTQASREQVFMWIIKQVCGAFF